MSTGGLLVDDGRTRVLIDTGLGDTTAIADLGRSNSGSFLDVLAEIGVARDSIDVVAFTHLHGDHTGWAVATDANGERMLTFPNADYLIAADEWANADTSPTGDPFSVITRLRELDAVTVIDDGDAVTSSIRAVVTPGHSPGHTSYVVTTSNGSRLVAFGDTFHTPLQIADPSIGSAPDNTPDRVPTARRRIMDELMYPETCGFGIHFGDQPFGRVADNRWEPIDSQVLLATPRRC